MLICLVLTLCSEVLKDSKNEKIENLSEKVPFLNIGDVDTNRTSLPVLNQPIITTQPRSSSDLNQEINPLQTDKSNSTCKRSKKRCCSTFSCCRLFFGSKTKKRNKKLENVSKITNDFISNQNNLNERIELDNQLNKQNILKNNIGIENRDCSVIPNTAISSNLYSSYNQNPGMTYHVRDNKNKGNTNKSDDCCCICFYDPIDFHYCNCNCFDCDCDCNFCDCDCNCDCDFD